MLQLQGDDRQVLGATAIGNGRDFGRQIGHRFAVWAEGSQRFEDKAASVVVLGALRQMRVEDGWRLPVQNLQQAALTATTRGWLGGGGGWCGGRRSGRRRWCGGGRCGWFGG